MSVPSQPFQPNANVAQGTTRRNWQSARRRCRPTAIPGRSRLLPMTTTSANPIRLLSGSPNSWHRESLKWLPKSVPYGLAQRAVPGLATSGKEQRATIAPRHPISRPIPQCQRRGCNAPCERRPHPGKVFLVPAAHHPQARSWLRIRSASEGGPLQSANVPQQTRPFASNARIIVLPRPIRISPLG
jgi:hypothetical protein